VKKLFLYLFLREVAKDPLGAKELRGRAGVETRKPRPQKSEIHGGTLQGEPTTAVCSLETLPALQ